MKIWEVGSMTCHRGGPLTDLVTEVLGIIQPVVAGSILAAGVVLALALGVVFVLEAASAATVLALPGFVPAPELI
jgi:hypothetical protein